MKKALLAVLIPTLLAGASSASAYDFIKNDDMKFNINGDLDLKMKFEDKEANDDSTLSTEANLDDIDIDAEWYVSDDLKYIGAFDFTIDDADAATEDSILDGGDEAWMGFESKTYGTFTAGQVLMPFDGFGIDSSEIDGGQASSYTDGEATKASEGFIYAYQAGDVELSVGYGNPGDSKDEDAIIQAKALYKAGDIEATFGAGTTTEYVSEEAITNVTYVQADYSQKFGDFQIGLLAGFETVAFTGASTAEDFTTTGIEVDLIYNLTSNFRVSAGMDYVTQDIDGNDDYTDFFVASRLKLTSNAYLHAEVFQAQGDIVSFDDGAQSTKKSGDLTKAQLYLNLQF